MKKILLILVVSVLAVNVSAQVSEGGLPPSYKAAGTKSSAKIAARTLGSIDSTVTALSQTGKTLPLKYSVLEKFSADIRKEGTRTDLEDGGTIWQYRLNSPEGKSLQVIFSRYMVPDGAQLFLYNELYTDIRGAFTEYNIREDLTFVTGDIRGNHVIIEYYEPAGVPFEGDVIIGSAGQAFTYILSPQSGNTDEDGFIGVNCIEGKGLQDVKHAVCRYTFNDGKYGYLCTGSLINNAGSTVQPYFLTAAHCISTPEEAATIVAYFNYEEVACTLTASVMSQSVSGASLLSTGSRSDYSLLRFERIVPTSYQPYYAGWEMRNIDPLSTSCIHHPGGKPKKVALDADPAGTNDIDLYWEGGSSSPSGTHWAVSFEEGTTAGGSSGGPLFNHNEKIIGQLHGGSETDYFGKLSYSWEHPDSQYPSLKSFLDPADEGVKSLEGYYPASNLPDPQFSAPFSKVCTGAPLKLEGFSAFEPTGYRWSFQPSSVSYSDGTDAYSASPKVSFLEETNYSINLRVTNAAGQKDLYLSNYISAGQELTLRALPADLADSCIKSFSVLKLTAYGADALLWTLSEKTAGSFYLEDNTSNPVEIRMLDGKPVTKSTDIEVTVTGFHGTCQNVLNISIPFVAQTNDNAAGALPLTPGKSGPFSNICATIEDGEPVPPYSSCTGQLSWCDEYGTGQNIVERSVWFSYTPDANQTISISSTGFDNQIAIYSAASLSSLLQERYTLLAANDDFNDTNPDPVISSVDVNANQKYWIQVDGSGGGATGVFYINISVLNSIGETLSGGDEVKVYPQPAGDRIYFESASFEQCPAVRIELTDTSGRVVLLEEVTAESGRVQLHPGNLAPGIYLARIYCDGKVSVTRIIV
ncbi:MAG: T9SS type A sorting domain-containing protein [Bacteroidales bacterium]|jgi:hypothetical protein|nr:T9SS type A sorting domain-containing protein [Bacteroidales bacterium]